MCGLVSWQSGQLTDKTSPVILLQLATIMLLDAAHSGESCVGLSELSSLQVDQLTGLSTDRLLIAVSANYPVTICAHQYQCRTCFVCV